MARYGTTEMRSTASVMLGRARQAVGATRLAPPKFSESTDESLMGLVAQRQTDAFDEIYRRHATAVASFLGRACADRHVVDEVTQSAFVTLWKRAGMYRPEAGRVRAWVTTIARNALIDRTRQRRLSLVPLDSAADWPAADSLPEQLVTDRERHRYIAQALAALSDEQRIPIELAFFGGLSQSEISRVLGEPLGTVKSRIRLGMQKLRRSLGAADGYQL